MKNAFIAIFLASFLLASPAILAQEPLDLSLARTELYIYSGETDALEVTVTNNQDVSRFFSISLVPSFLGKVGAFPETAASNFLLTSKESKTVKLFFSVLPEAEETTIPALFTIFATSSDDEISANKSVKVNVLRTSPVYLSELKLNKHTFDPEETLQINNVITNTGNSPSASYRLQISIKKGNDLIQQFDETISDIGRKSSETITKTHTFDQYAAPGFYKLSVSLKNNLGTLISAKSFDIKVNEVNKTTSDSSLQLRLLSVDKTIAVKNVGNVPTSIVVKEFVPAFAKDWVVTITDPVATETVGGSVVYRWVLTLEPGDEMSVKYQFNVWNVWLGLLIILGVIYYTFKYVFAASITKVVKVHGALTKGKEIVVTLELKNRSMNEVKDIVVTDVVPQLTQVVQQFDTLRPKIKKTTEGTELSWKLDSLKAGEERIINYRIKPTVDVVGSLELPSAMMVFHDRKRVKKSVVSRAVTAAKV